MDRQPPTGTRVVRRINTATVLDAVRRGPAEPMRLTELVELTGLTRPTVTQAVDELIESGWLRQHAAVASSQVGGRPAIRVSLNGRAAPVFGLDVGPHTVSAGVADLTGTRLAMIRRPVRRRGARHLLAVIGEVTTETLAAADVAAAEVAMATVGTPGIVDRDSGRVLFAPSIPGWTSIDLADHLRAVFGCPVRVENDANLAAVAIAHEHDCHGTLLAVQWGERLGAGVVIDGRLHRGAGEAGEIGFIRPPGQPPHSAGERGPLELAIGAEAIRARMEVDDAAEVFTSAAAGDAAALDVVDEVALTFAEAIAPAVLVLSPDDLVISGGIARAGDVLLDAVRRHLTTLTLTPPNVALSSLMENTVLTGALRIALNRVWQDRLGDFVDSRPSLR